MGEVNIIYPPILESSLPPITVKDSEYNIDLPITYNRFNTIDIISGCVIKFVSTISGKILGYAKNIDFVDKNTKRSARFTFTKIYKDEGCTIPINADNILIAGNYYKIAAIFTRNIGTEAEPNHVIAGAYSTFGITKVIEDIGFDVSIGGLIEKIKRPGEEEESTYINYARGQYIGKFSFTDRSEKVKEYRFRVYSNGAMVYDTGYLNHNNSVDTINSSTN